MLEVEASVKPAFNNTLTGKQKLMECIRLDGAVLGFLCALTDCALTEAVHMVLMSKQQGKISQRVSTNAFRQQHDLDRFCSVQSIRIRRIISLSYEGPSHLEVQFWWTLRHFQKPTLLPL